VALEHTHNVDTSLDQSNFDGMNTREDLLKHEDTPEKLMTKKQRLTKLRQWFNELSDRERSTLFERHLCDEPKGQKEIAQKTGITFSAVSKVERGAIKKTSNESREGR